MKLYGSLTSPYVRKIRALVIEKNLRLDFEIIATSMDPNSPARRLNPLFKVPVLELGDGQVLFDSPVIAEFLDAQSEPRLIPQQPDRNRWSVLRLCALADGIADAVVTRLLEGRRPEAQRSASAIAHEEARITRAIEALEQEVAQAGASPGSLPRPLVGETLTLSDLAVAAAMDYVDFRHPHAWQERAPRLATWLEAVLERPALRDTAPPTT